MSNEDNMINQWYLYIENIKRFSVEFLAIIWSHNTEKKIVTMFYIWSETYRENMLIV